MERYRRIAATIGWAGLVSMFSLASAWAAIAFLLGGNLKFTVVFATIAFLLDAADGALARKLGTASDFGRQLDGMIDAMNYSLLAALIAQRVLMPGLLGWLVGFVILAFGIIRLVLFNIDGYHIDGDVKYYRGVVTPHLSLACLFIISLEKAVAIPQWLVAAVLLGLAVGQVSLLKVRKTGALAFWIPASILIGIGGYLWL